MKNKHRSLIEVVIEDGSIIILPAVDYHANLAMHEKHKYLVLVKEAWRRWNNERA